MIDLQKAITHAQHFGAEAAANQRHSINSDDRSDIAVAYGVDVWREIPAEHQEQLIEAFQEGFRREKAINDH